MGLLLHRPHGVINKDEGLIARLTLLLSTNVITTDELRALLDRHHITLHEYVEVLMKRNQLEVEDEEPATIQQDTPDPDGSVS